MGMYAIMLVNMWSDRAKDRQSKGEKGTEIKIDVIDTRINKLPQGNMVVPWQNRLATAGYHGGLYSVLLS